MKHFIILLVLFCYNAIESQGQTIFIKLKIDAISPKQGTKTIVLMETDMFKVLTTYKLFVDNCDNVIKKYDLDWDKDLLRLFIDQDSAIIYADSLMSNEMQKSRLIFRISNLLENGNCIIINKKKKVCEKSITLEKYSTKYVYGKRFKTEGGYLILETEDGVY